MKTTLAAMRRGYLRERNRAHERPA